MLMFKEKMNDNLENITLNETVLKTDENKYNLKKIDTEIIKNQVLMKNTFYAFKKSGNCRICNRKKITY